MDAPAFALGVALLDWIGVAVFAITGALVASRNQMDVVGFIMLGTVTAIGGGTVRDLLLGIEPVWWIARPSYLILCIIVSVAVFFTAHLMTSRYRVLLWMDAIGMPLFAVIGAERAVSVGAAPVVALVMGVITATFGGIIRDILGHERSVIFGHELYVTVAAASALTFIGLDWAGLPMELSISVAVLVGLGLRAGALVRGWSLPRYRPHPPRFRPED